jgi:SAM-dependent MidA family methyltransferase
MPERAWAVAMADALYGAGGFYRSSDGPAGHFRTSSHVGAAFAEAVRRCAVEVDTALGQPAVFDVVDVGAGRGELLTALADRGVSERWRLTGVEVVDRPPGVPQPIRWQPDLPERVTGLVVANEWLDTIPLDIAVMTEHGPRLVLVGDDGSEVPGPPLMSAHQQWLDRWWPLAAVGDRGEIGSTRDDAWSTVIRSIDRGVAVAVDYTHLRRNRPAAGTLCGYRRGAAVAPLPDTTCDVTAHVALDACAHAGRLAGAPDSILMTQRSALRRLGVDAQRPLRTPADPKAYLSAVALAGAQAELIDRAGLGAFSWLIQSKHVRAPASFASSIAADAGDES